MISSTKIGLPKEPYFNIELTKFSYIELINLQFHVRIIACHSVGRGNTVHPFLRGNTTHLQ